MIRRRRFGNMCFAVLTAPRRAASAERRSGPKSASSVRFKRSRGGNRRIDSLTSQSSKIADCSPWEMRMRCHFLQIIGRFSSRSSSHQSMEIAPVRRRKVVLPPRQEGFINFPLFRCTAEREGKEEREVFHYHLAVPISSSRGN